MQRNVLFIVSDQFRADALGAYGNDVVRTPNLDRLATEGCSFTGCYCQASPCGPSRASIHMSRYLCAHRSTENHTPLVNAERNFGNILAERGYRPLLIGNHDYTVDPRTLPSDDPRVRSFSYDNALPGYETLLYHEYDSPEYFAYLRTKGYPEELLTHDAVHTPTQPADGPGEHYPAYFPARYRAEDSECHFVVDRAIEFLRVSAGEQRERGWILNLNILKPHGPHVACEPYFSMYRPREMPEAVRRAGELEAEHPYLRAVAERDLLDELHRREFLCVYYAMVSEVDANIGRLLSVLDETGQRENTLVVFTSDHGEYAGDHYLSGKTHFYDAGMRVPLIIRDPSKEADSGRGVIHREGFVEAIDIAPTIFAYLGEEIPRDFQGRNVLDSVRSGQQAGLRTEIHYENDFRNRIPKAERGPSQEGCLMWVLRDACYKYVQFADDSFPPLLFDMVRDPGEFVDLAAERPQLVARYGQRMLRWRMVNEDQDSERMKAARDAQSD